MRHLDPKDHSASENYKLLTSLVIPRPIAWVSTQSPDGIINLAPFSFFNAIGSDPLFILISVGAHSDGSAKDTARNILANGEFVVNLVTEELVDAMNITASDYPAGESELDAAGLHAAPSHKITVPRVAEAQASLECRLHSTQVLGTNTLVIGEVVMFNIADHLLGDRLQINRFSPIGRLGSPAYYCRTDDRFEVKRIPGATVTIPPDA